MNTKGIRTAFEISFLLWLAIILFIANVVAGCSADCTKVTCNQPAAAPTSPAATVLNLPFDLKGSVTSAFQVIVDGIKYDDMEAYYTSVISTLDQKVQQLGYVGYSAKFDAQLGYADLATGMTVYVTPSTDRGYQGKTTVKSDGTFDITLPPDGGDTYQIKATKRLSLTLTKAQDVKKFCFNFSGVNLSVPYSDKDKPIVLNAFQSTITAYECQVDPTLEGGLPIPAAPVVTTTATGSSTSTSTSTDLQSQLITVGQQVTAAEISGGSDAH